MDSSVSIYSTCVVVTLVEISCYDCNSIWNVGMGNYRLGAYLCNHGQYHAHANALMQRIQPRLSDKGLMGWFRIMVKFMNNNACYLVVVLTSPLHTSPRKRAIHLLGVKVTLRYNSLSSDMTRRCVLRAEPPPPCFESSNMIQWIVDSHMAIIFPSVEHTYSWS